MGATKKKAKMQKVVKKHTMIKRRKCYKGRHKKTLTRIIKSIPNCFTIVLGILKKENSKNCQILTIIMSLSLIERFSEE